MYDPEPSFDEEYRQFNLPGYLIGQIFNPGGGYYPDLGNNYPDYGGYPGGGNGPQPAAPPSAPPPPFTPEQPLQTYAIDSGAIQRCRFHFTYVWMRRESFWFYPTFIGRNSISGFRWFHHRWVYFGVDLNQIEAFQCF